MRYVSDIKPNVIRPDSSLVPGLSSVHAVKAIHPREQLVTQVAVLRSKQGGLEIAEDEHLLRLPTEDRRKACRRIHTQKVLIELRSGVDRRHHDLLGNHATEHIDEKA